MDSAASGTVVDGSIVKVESTSSMEANVGVLMRRATDVAGVCREIVTRTANTIQGRKYVRVEGWQAMAVAYGCVLSARDVEKVEGGFRAIGEVRRMSDGAVIATAEGFVGDDEDTWKGRHEYAKRAMAQTRAQSRAGRTAFSFLVTLIDSNMSTTPSEEMEGVHVGSETPPPPRPVGAAGVKSALQQPPPSPPQSVGAAVRQSAENEGAKPTHDRNVSFRFGNAKNTPLHSLSEGDLKFYEKCLQQDLTNPEKQRFAQSNTLALANVQAEMRFRGI